MGNSFDVSAYRPLDASNMWEEFASSLGGSNESNNNGFGLAQSIGAYNIGQNQQAGLGVGNNLYKTTSPDWWSMEGALRNGQTGGWVSPALQGLQSLFSWTQGNKALDLAEDQFKFNKEITQKNLANQTSLLNTSMRDRQNARRAASSSYQDTDSYMREHGL